MRVRAQQLATIARVADVAATKRVARVALEVAQVLEVAGVGQRVEVDDQVARPLAAQQADEVRADEAGAAGDQYRRDSSGGPRATRGAASGRSAAARREGGNAPRTRASAYESSTEYAGRGAARPRRRAACRAAVRVRRHLRHAGLASTRGAKPVPRASLFAAW